MQNEKTRRNAAASNARRADRAAYVEGTSVRKLSVVEMPGKEADKQIKRQQIERPVPVRRANRNPVQEQHLGFGYMVVMALCAVATMWICANYLQLQAENTRSIKHIAALENQLSELKTENDDEYNRLMSSVDLNSIREIAINELGMVYANPDQVVLYDSQTNDYVRQYEEVPQEESSWLDGLFGSK